MGHSWRELDPQGAARHDAEINFKIKIKKAIANRSLGDFTCDDLSFLMKLQISANHISLDNLKQFAEKHDISLE
jgi:hypothetical protein